MARLDRYVSSRLSVPISELQSVNLNVEGRSSHVEGYLSRVNSSGLSISCKAEFRTQC